MDGKRDAWEGNVRRTLQGAIDVKLGERRRNGGRRITDGAVRIGSTLVRTVNSARRRAAGEAANDATFQNQPISERLCAKSRANRCIFRALLRKLQTAAARAASPALTGLFGLLAEVVWGVKTITSPQ